ncbi:MAG: sugar transferase [Halocynthiibacter sp.]
MKNQFINVNTAKVVMPVQAQTPYIAWQKRFLDVLCVFISLPVVVPLIFLFWLAIRLDGGPGFFVQKRVGQEGLIFYLWKLRTMHPDAETRLEACLDADPQMRAEWAHKQKLTHDPRVTRIGRFMRRANIDELPQLLNVLRGEMSLIGPRPFLPSQEKQYRQGGGRAYYRLLPGLSGFWQISARSTSGFLERVRYDEAYADEISLWTDLRVIACTLGTFLHRTGV